MSCIHCGKDFLLTAVYVATQPGFAKIGASRDPVRRMQEIQMHNPIKLTLRFEAWYLSTSDAKRAERRLHKLLPELHVRGEWFACASPSKLIGEIISILEDWPLSLAPPQQLEVL